MSVSRPITFWHSPLDPDHEVNFWLSGDVEITRLSSLSLQPDLFLLLVPVLSHVLVRSLEDDFSGCFGCLVEGKGREKRGVS